MNAWQIRMWLAAPMASLFLILGVCAFAIQRTPSEGIYIPVLRLSAQFTENEFSCDGRFHFVQLMADGTTKLNEQSIPFEQLEARLAERMEGQLAKAVFVVPDSDISYQRFVAALDAIHNASSDVHIGVLSGELRHQYQQGWESDGLLEPRHVPCDLIWPSQEFHARP